MPAPRLFVPGGGGGSNPGITLKDHGTVVGQVTSIDVEGTGIAASAVGSAGTITAPPPPPPTFGYWADQNNQPTNRLSFNTDATAMVAKGNLVGSGFADVSGANSTNFGYFGSTNIARLNFANDAANMVSVNVMDAGVRDNHGQGAVNSATNGYWAGFDEGGNLGSLFCYSLDFANDANAMVAVGQLTVARSYMGGVNSATHGYFSGGTTAGTATLYNNTDRLDFANDAANMVAVANLGSSICELAGANSTTFGYLVGGSNSPTGALGSSVNTNWGLNFANDAAAMLAKGSLGTARLALSGANSTLKAYFAGGQDNFNNQVLTCSALTFASDATAMVAVGQLVTQKTFGGACQSGGIL